MSFGEFVQKYPTLRFVKYSVIALPIQWALIVLYIWLSFALDRRDIYWFEEPLLWAYLWPLLVLPQGHSHGGEFLFMPITAFFMQGSSGWSWRFGSALANSPELTITSSAETHIILLEEIR